MPVRPLIIRTAAALLLLLVLSVCYSSRQVSFLPSGYSFGSEDSQPFKLPLSFTREHSVATVSLQLRLGLLAPRRYHIVPDDCLEQLTINGKVYSSSLLPFCDWEEGRVLDFRDYLRSGTNEIRMEVRNIDGQGGVNISVDRRDPLSFLLKVSFLLVLVWYSFCLIRCFNGRVKKIQIEPDLVRSFLYIALIGCSLAQFSFYLLHEAVLSEALLGNILDLDKRHEFLEWIIVWTCTVVCVAAVLFFVVQHRLQSHAQACARFWNGVLITRPLILIFMFPVILQTKPWLRDEPFYLCLSLVVCVLFGFWCLPWLKPLRALSRLPYVRRIPPVFVWLCIAGYAAYVSVHTIEKHYALGTSAFDMGIFENAFWNSINGHFMYSSIVELNLLGGQHTFFILVPLIPVYWLFPHTETLLIAQAVLVALAAWPLYLVSRFLLSNSWLAFLFSFMYLIHPGVAGANFYDFHPLTIAPVLFFSAFYFWLKKRQVLFWTFVLLLLLVKEDLSIVVSCLGIYALLDGQRQRGVRLLVVGIASYVILQRLTISYLGEPGSSYSFYFADLIPEDEGPSGLLTTFLINPIFSLRYALSFEKLRYLVQLLAPFGFLALFSLRGFTLLAYGLVLSLAAKSEAFYHLGFQYSYHVIPYAAIGALIYLAKHNDDSVKVKSLMTRSQIVVICVLLSLVTCYHYGMIYPRHNFNRGHKFSISAQERERYLSLMDLVKMIPSNASVVAQGRLVPHVARRKEVRALRHILPEQAEDYDYYLVSNSRRNILALRKLFHGRRPVLVKVNRYFRLFKSRADNH